MSAMHNLRLPASELAKQHPLRARDHADPRDHAVRLAAAPEAATAVPPRRPRPARHLSGFARA